MTFWSTTRKNGNSKRRNKENTGMMGLEELDNVKGEVSNIPRLDMNHGFIKSIVRNQIDRDEYDKLVSERSVISPSRSSEKPRKTCNPQLLYIPPHLRGVDRKSTKNEKENSETADEKAALRKEIRRRLMEQMAKEEHERLQMSTEAMVLSPTPTKRDAGIRRRSDATSVPATPTRNEPLFKLNVRGRDGNLVEQIIHANDNGARVAKALTRQLELSDEQCRLLRNRIEEELEKRLAP